MKIQLNSNGQIINPPLRVAQRYINLGRAHEVEAGAVSVEAKPIEVKPVVKEVDVIQPIPEQVGHPIEFEPEPVVSQVKIESTNDEFVTGIYIEPEKVPEETIFREAKPNIPKKKKSKRKKKNAKNNISNGSVGTAEDWKDTN